MLAIAAVVGFSAASAFASSTWLETINVAETGGINMNLQFGVHPNGTNGVDNGLGGTTLIDEDNNAAADEIGQPPLPPAGNFDARFSTQLILDYRAGTEPQASHTYALQFQRAAGGNIVLTWNPATLGPKVVSAVLQDAFGGVLGVNQNMTTAGSITITNAAITSVNIILTSVANYVPPVPYTRIVITNQPTAAGNAPLSLGNITVRAETAGGTPANTNVTIIATENGVGSLAGTTTQTATNASGGVATFANLVYSNLSLGAPSPEVIALTFSAVDFQGNPINVVSNNISVTQPPIGIPVLTGPPAAVPGVTENQTPAFTWTAAVNAVSYQFSMGTAPACNSISNNVAVAGTSYTSGRVADGSYCAKVRAVDALGTAGAYSNTVTFNAIPTFGEWGLVLLIGSMVLAGGFFLQRRRAGSNA
jgi:hypothetical protein